MDQVLNYLFRPIRLPHFSFNPVTFRQSISATIDHLIADALEHALPAQTLGAQFIYARRRPLRLGDSNTIALGFEHPLIMKGGTRDQRRALADGLSYVTYLLNSKQSPSFHSRVRRHDLTDAPAVCIFSSSPIACKENETRLAAINVIHATLPVASSIRAADFPLDQIEEIPGNLFRANLLPTLDSYAQVRTKRSRNPTRTSPRIICTAYEDRNRKHLLRDLANDLGKDSPYLDRVSYLLQFGNIILCTPHAYTAPLHDVENANSFNEQLADSGLTVILRRDEPIREIDWVRVQTVAQILAVFAGAALSTADRARAHIANRLSESVGHEFRNTVTSIYSKIRELSEDKKPLSKCDALDVHGRLEFTGQLIEAALMLEDESDTDAQELLDRLTKPLAKYTDLRLTHDLRIVPGSRVSAMWCIVLVEALRNSFKHAASVEGVKTIKITARTGNANLSVEIANRSSIDGGTNSNSKGLRLMEEIARELGGSFNLIPRHDEIVARVVMPTANDPANNSDEGKRSHA